MLSPLSAFSIYAAGAVLLIAAVRWWRREPGWLAGLLYAALAIAFFLRPVLGTSVHVPSDLAYETRPWSETLATPVAVHNRRVEDTLLEQLPFHTLVRRRLLAGEMPLWSHELGTGQPLLGNAQSAPFAPLHLLALPLPPLQALPASAAWAMLLHLLLAHVLARTLGAGPLGAALAAVAVGLSTYSVVWAYDTLGMSSAWVPGVLLGTVLLARGVLPAGRGIAAVPACELAVAPAPAAAPGIASDPAIFAAAAPAGCGHAPGASGPAGTRGALPGLVVCALGVATGGHPETLAHTALAALVVAAALALRLPRPSRRRFAARLAAAAALSAALAAPVLLPFAQTLPHSQRWDALDGGADPFVPPPFEARYLLPAIDPLAFGGPFGPTLRGPLDFVEMCSGYAGVLTLALAAAGAVAWGGRILAILLGGLAALLAALRVWPLFQLLSAVPILEQATQARLRAFWVLGVALAAGLALDRLAASRRARACALAAAVLATVALLLAGPAPGAWEYACWCTAMAGLEAAIVTLTVPRWRPFFAATALAAVAADLFLLGAPYHPSLSPRYDLAPPPALAFLVRQARRSPSPFRILAADFDLRPNLAAVYGLWDPRGNDPMRPADPLRLLGARMQPNHEVGQRLRAMPGSFDAGFYDFLSIRYLLVRHGRLLPPPWHPAFAGIGGEVWENPRALPLFFMPRRLLRTATAEEAQLATSQLEDFSDLGVALAADAAAPHADAAASFAEATAEPAAAPAPAAAPLPPAQAAGDIRDIRPCSNGFRLRVLSGGGIVVSSVSYDPAWRVEIDHRPARAIEVDSGFLGFAVPPGAHRVRLDYRPGGWTAGLALCALGLTISIASRLRPALERRRHHRRSTAASRRATGGERLEPVTSLQHAVATQVRIGTPTARISAPRPASR
jgi:hypothetical protein